jgi:4-amino-4-deoxy-L-arabinose transferase-like glycosyltransferase
MNILLGILLIALIGWWAGRLWGRAAGLLACALAATDPNLAAFAALVSMDLGLALFSLAAAYSLWEYSRSGSRYWFVAAGIALGLALAAKFSAVIVVAGLGVAAIGLVLAGGSLTPNEAATRKARLSSTITAFVRLGLIAAGVVIVVYFGIHALDWPRGLKQQLVRGDKGDPHFFLNGKISSTGWWHYFPVVLAIKTPPGTILLALVSIAAFRFGKRFERRDIAFVLGPAIVYFVAMTASKIDIGWRVILPAYPALILLAARSATLALRARLPRTIWSLLLVAAVLPGAIDRQSELSYSNRLLVGPENLHRQLGDSNLDWGQGLKALQIAVIEERASTIYFSYAGTARPEAYGINYERLPSWGQFHPPPSNRVDPIGRVLVAVSVSNLQGTYLPDPTLYRWLLDREPISRTDGSIWLFDISQDEEAIHRIRKIAAKP